MLVLSRKPGQTVVVPEVNLQIKIVEVCKNGTVRLGLTAPDNVTFLRSEIANQPPPEDKVKA